MNGYILPPCSMPNLAWKLNVVSLRKLHTEETPERIVSETRIEYLRIELTGSYSFAGAVRNQALNYVKTSWVAFLDDDDSVSSDYVALLVNETGYPQVGQVSMDDIGAVVFRTGQRATSTTRYYPRTPA